MDRDQIIFRLQVIALLDSFSYGLLYIFISPYLMHLGGDNVTIGIFTVTTLMFQLMSIHIVKDMVNFEGQKAALTSIFHIAAICHALLFLTSSTCSIIMARCIFCSTNQSTNLIKDFIIKNLPPERKEYHMNVYEILYFSGFVFGPVITGALFDISFKISCFLASLLTIINIWILSTIPGLDNFPSESSDVPALRRVRQSVERSLVELAHFHSIKNWDVLALQYLFTASVIIFSTKYSPVLKHNYHTTRTDIGLVSSYMNIVVFTGIKVCPDLIENLKSRGYSPFLILNVMSGILFASSILALYSPLLGLFCLMCIPVTFSRIMIVNTWDAFVTERGNQNLTKASESANIIAGLTIPLIFGVAANRIDYQAVIIFAVFPVLLMLYIVNFITVFRAPSALQDQRDRDHRAADQPNECSCVTKALTVATNTPSNHSCAAATKCSVCTSIQRLEVDSRSNSCASISSVTDSRNDPIQRPRDDDPFDDSSVRRRKPEQNAGCDKNNCTECTGCCARRK